MASWEHAVPVQMFMHEDVERPSSCWQKAEGESKKSTEQMREDKKPIVVHLLVKVAEGHSSPSRLIRGRFFFPLFPFFIFPFICGRLLPWERLCIYDDHKPNGKSMGQRSPCTARVNMSLSGMHFRIWRLGDISNLAGVTCFVSDSLDAK